MGREKKELGREEKDKCVDRFKKNNDIRIQRKKSSCFIAPNTKTRGVVEVEMKCKARRYHQTRQGNTGKLTSCLIVNYYSCTNVALATPHILQYPFMPDDDDPGT